MILSYFLFVPLLFREVHSPRCRSSRLPLGVSIVESCSFRPLDSCTVRCNKNGVTKWKTKVHCMENGRWSSLPMCSSRLRERSLEPIDCDTLPIKIKRKAFCVKIRLTNKAKKCPDLFHIRMDMRNCSRNANSHCIISCGNSYANVTCLSNGQWSNMPDCKFARESMCPVPEVGALVNCSRAEGEHCKIRCPGGNIMPDDIVCLSSGIWGIVHSKHKTISETKSKWEIISKCTCPPPSISEAFEATQDCSNKKIGEKCHVKCKPQYSIIGKRTIVCGKNAAWSNIPTCSNITCPEPKLTNLLKFREDCSSKLSGQSCKLQCKGKMKLIQHKPFTCINGTQWSKLPVCACLSPKLPEGMIATKACLERKVGSTCQLKCEKNYSMQGSTLITCQKDGSWTTLPECRKNSCRKLNLPKSLMFSEDCHSKITGQTCKVECLNTEETYEITCLNNTHWSPLPKCSCPIPSFAENIELKGNCSTKKPGEKCKVRCKNLPSLKHLHVTCLNNSHWSNEPPCKNFACPKPVLPNYLLFDEDCTNKGRGDRCRLICKMGGKPFYERSVKCLKGRSWSHFPMCTCPIPYIREDLETVSSCNLTKPNEKCIVRCKESSLIGDGFIVCKNDTTWTSQPSCSRKFCIKPKVPSSLSVEKNCSFKSVGDECEVFCTEGGNVKGENVIICLENLQWSSFPPCTCPEPNLKDGLLPKDNCTNKMPGEKCEVICNKNLTLIGSNTISCLPNSKWSLMPKCEANICRKPELPRYLVFEDACLSKVPGEECLVSCRNGGEIIGNSKIKCLNFTLWSPIPNCGCFLPVLKENLVSIDNCNRKSIGTKCNLRCEGGKMLIGSSFIICQNNQRWSSQPECRTQICIDPLPANSILEHKDCSSKTVGESCTLRCLEGGKIIGSDTIKCLNETQWSELPDCTCPEPVIPETLQLKENCTFKTRGDRCKIKCKGLRKPKGGDHIICSEKSKWSSFPSCETILCPKPLLPREVLIPAENCNSKISGENCSLICKEGGNFVGNNYIECLENGSWSHLPDCTCPNPILNESFIIAENCSAKKKGEECKLSCKNGNKISGNGKIVCQNNTQWSRLLSCEEQICQKPNIPLYLKSKEDCSSKYVGEMCELSCSERGHLMGGNSVTCFSNLSWSSFPNCTCPEPNLKEDLRSENCSFKIPGEKCHITCKDEWSLAEHDFFMCNNNTKWSAQPHCLKANCRDFNFPAASVYSGKCINKSAGDRCFLRCKSGGKFVDGRNHITCKKNGLWSRPGKCFCPPLVPSNEYILKDNCSDKLPGDVCHIACKNGAELHGKNVIKCDNLTRWPAFPPCRPVLPPVSCLNPKNALLKHSFGISSDCEHRKTFLYNDSCKITCLNGGLFITKNTIQCLSTGKWSKLPLCSCPPPVLKDNIKQAENCSMKFHNDKCILACKDGFRFNDGRNFIQCINKQWNPTPICEPISNTSFHNLSFYNLSFYEVEFEEPGKNLSTKVQE